nr:hypothetical protein [Tanacetum cinerariifolium]
LAELCSKYDPVMVVSLVGRIIQDTEKFEQLVDHLHLFHTPEEVLKECDDRVRTSASSVAFTDSSTREIRHSLVAVSLEAGLSVFKQPLGLPPSFADTCTDDVSNNLNLSSKRNAELNVGRFSRIMLGIVGGGIGASPDVVIVAMGEGVIIGVGGIRDTIWEDVFVKIDSTPSSLSGFNMLETNDDIEELSCGSSGLTGV